MDTLERLLSKDTESLDIFKQFKMIENIYDNSLIAMGYKVDNKLIVSSTNAFLSNIQINSDRSF
jgi:hypothetical protein